MKITATTGAHEWHGITHDNHTKAMQVPGGALVRTATTASGRSISVALVFLPDVVVAHRWVLEGDEAHREIGLQQPDRSGWLHNGWRLVSESLGDPPEGNDASVVEAAP